MRNAEGGHAFNASVLRLIAIVALIVACIPPQATPTTRTSSPRASLETATAAPPTATPTPTSTATPGASPSIVGSLDRVDVDGDGKMDTVTLETAWSEASPGNTDSTVKAALATGKALSLTLHDTFDPALALVADADGDHRDEVFVRVWLGASTEFWVIVALDGDQLVTVREKGATDDLRLAVGGSVTHGDGFECRTSTGGEHELVVKSFQQTTLNDTVYAWQGKTLVKTGSSVTQFREDMRNDPNFSAYYSARCGQPTR